ncbi:hypothetical protein KAR91_64935 [Candidatus Pacearchaeota archaeon]|nr:hypothetical protein [Candidatus Pacearchaeota archaeon]
MLDSSFIERWNVISAATMAVGMGSLLSRLINDKPMPFDYEEALEQGMEFLLEAGDGGAIICGQAKARTFSGTLSPLDWSMNAYIVVAPKDERENVELYKNVVEELNNYQDLLLAIKNKSSIEEKQAVLGRAYKFFKSLSNDLLSQADPVSKVCSEPVY